jgi:hypothetical protein
MERAPKGQSGKYKSAITRLDWWVGDRVLVRIVGVIAAGKAGFTRFQGYCFRHAENLHASTARRPQGALI